MTTKSIPRKKRRGARVTVAALLERNGVTPQRGIGRHRYIAPDESPTRILAAVPVSTVTETFGNQDELVWQNRNLAHHRAPTRAQLWWGSVMVASLIAVSMFQAWPVVA